MSSNPKDSAADSKKLIILSRTLSSMTFTLTSISADVALFESDVAVTVIVSDPRVVFSGTVIRTNIRVGSVFSPINKEGVDSVTFNCQPFFDVAVVVSGASCGAPVTLIGYNKK